MEEPLGGADNVVVQAIGLQKKYPGAHALKGVSLEVRKGEVFCVIGPNAAGKTTLLYLLGGVIFPSAGHVTVFGLDRWKDNFEIRKRSAVLPAEPVFGASPCPYEYLRFLAQIYELPRDILKDKVRQLAREMNLLPHITKEWSRLSLGFRKKTGLIGCFLPDVPLRILDEPFAGGIDPLGMEVLFAWMGEAREKGETIVFSTQVLDQAEHVADRIALIHEGAIIALGSPRELIERAHVSASEPRPLAKAFMVLTKAALKG
ncbi:ABC transporter ATP-binding protein [Candidatus Sumerlaeota bacterium]|nr:ABC transporter ATP-binding protein [Candidatus Sumerlaeota bacterium]